MNRLLTIAPVLSALTLTLLAAPPAHAQDPAAVAVTALRTSPRAPDGARITKAERVDARTVDLTIASPALGRDGHARVLLPPSYRPRHRHPVLYLLHGCCDAIPGWTAWTANTDVEALSARSRAMVVMPEAGPDGMYTDWYNGGRYGPPAWETFHLAELRALVERGLGAGPRRAVAGLSMGGLGALAYAARHPGMFRASASFSGLADTVGFADGLMDLVAAYGDDPLGPFGDPVEQAAVWRAHNPLDLVPRLRGVRLFVASGDGRPGPLDAPGTPQDALEASLGQANAAFVAKARRHHLDLTADLYGPGTHTWPYWERELHRAFPLLMRAISG
ncbi:alpha/beta hydrolase [Actinomadura fibrosa]|uniref:Alpha/beta hydrolase n=1 Tax=Actinomadura fibrosa TaxID=111802 RepID=A0ABW2XYX4_9ACTN|nr:alpha/beta hydrolase family protein [Actinomadura fibrosa]